VPHLYKGRRLRHAAPGDRTGAQGGWKALEIVYSLHDSPVLFAVTEAVMGALVILGVAAWIAYKTKRFGLVLTIGTVLAALVSLRFSNVQAVLVLDSDYIAVQKLHSGGYRLRKDEVVSVAEFRKRGGGTALVITARSGERYGITVASNRQPRLEELLAKELDLTAEPLSDGLKRWSRRS
jgi:hypothetical protein